MTRRKAYYTRKIKRATHLLFYQRHRKPGARGWELRKKLGADYPRVLEILNKHLEKLDLQVKTVFEEEKPVKKPTLKQLNKARFYITLRGELTAKETKMMGWRIDDIAGLAITISQIISKREEHPVKRLKKFYGINCPGGE